MLHTIQRQSIPHEVERIKRGNTQQPTMGMRTSRGRGIEIVPALRVVGLKHPKYDRWTLVSSIPTARDSGRIGEAAGAPTLHL